MKVTLAAIFIGIIATTYAEFEAKCPKDGTGSELLPDPEDCRKLWQCTDYVPHEAYCPDLQYFDAITLSCVDKDKAVCAETLAPEEPKEPEQPPVDCPKKSKPTDNVLLPNPKDCGSFYQCAHGYPYLMLCPKGLHYNPMKYYCDWPELAKCTITP